MIKNLKLIQPLLNLLKPLRNLHLERASFQSLGLIVFRQPANQQRTPRLKWQNLPIIRVKVRLALKSLVQNAFR